MIFSLISIAKKIIIFHDLLLILAIALFSVTVLFVVFRSYDYIAIALAPLSLMILACSANINVTILKHNYQLFCENNSTEAYLIFKRQTIIKSFVKAVIAFLLCLFIFLIVASHRIGWLKTLTRGVYYDGIAIWELVTMITIAAIFLAVSVLVLKKLSAKLLYAHAFLISGLLLSTVFLLMTIEEFSITFLIYSLVFMGISCLIGLFYTILLYRSKQNLKNFQKNKTFRT